MRVNTYFYGLGGPESLGLVHLPVAIFEGHELYDLLLPQSS